MLGEATMKTCILITLTLAGLTAELLAQSSPAQPVDPTAQQPSTSAPATPPTFEPGMKRSAEESAAPSSPRQSAGTTFVGTIIKKRHTYILKAEDAEYLLDDHGEAKKYKGKSVRVTGSADDNHMIRVKRIELSPVSVD